MLEVKHFTKLRYFNTAKIHKEVLMDREGLTLSPENIPGQSSLKVKEGHPSVLQV